MSLLDKFGRLPIDSIVSVEPIKYDSFTDIIDKLGRPSAEDMYDEIEAISELKVDYIGEVMGWAPYTHRVQLEPSFEAACEHEIDYLVELES